MYHEDTVTKEKLSNDDIKFLKELQKELNTEDNAGTASPRYWVIRQPERIYHVDKDEADGFEFFDEQNRHELTLEDLKDKLENLCDDNLKSIEVKNGILTFASIKLASIQFRESCLILFPLSLVALLFNFLFKLEK